MNWQAIIVGVIIFLAFLYAANMVWKRVKSFSPKSACGTDCGCEAKSKEKSLPHIIKQ
ncbi:MAG TPA: FeoB-associated Cys-rich membrane protein [Pyrinomonadaceae bacterium]|nr:FeoB-associated Cys-rich membrane protein [Pyrinomonadaceae bacterium]